MKYIYFPDKNLNLAGRTEYVAWKYNRRFEYIYDQIFIKNYIGWMLLRKILEIPRPIMYTIFEYKWEMENPIIDF